MNNEKAYRFYIPYLTSGEHVLWKGKPAKGKLLDSTDVFMIPFSLMWCGFVVLWELAALRDYSVETALFGIPFALLGLYLAVGRFVHRVWLRKRTYYVITNLKILRLQNKKVDMVMGRNLPQIQVIHTKDGCGTIQIGRADYRSKSFQQLASGGNGAFSLVNIPDVLRVQQILTQIASE